MYTDDNKPKYSNNPKEILKFAENFHKKLYTKENVSNSATEEFLNKIPKNKKILNEYFNLCEADISLDEVIEFINSQRNNKFPRNDGLTTEFYEHFSK